MPARFETALVVESLATDEARNARLARPLVFVAGDGRRFTVPAGFTTDLASIPQWAQALIGKWERHAPAAVLHDWLYARRETTRAEADRLFAEALFAAGVPLWKRVAMWLSVRIRGGRAWRIDPTTIGDPMARSARRAPPTLAQLADEYRALWDALEIRPGRLAAVTATATKIRAARARYEKIEAATGVPWYVVGVIHAMESALRFDRHLHNGDPLTRPTVQVPVGRPPGPGPFTFEASAVDALRLHRLDAVERWDLPRIAYELERYNGWGYRWHHPDVASPYLWSYTTHYTCGKYVADGKWSPTAVSGQSGALAILRRLVDLEPSIDLLLEEPDPAREFTRTPEVEAASTAPSSIATSSTANTAVAVGSGGGLVTATEISNAFSTVAKSGKAFSLAELFLALAQSPTFWVGLLTLAGSVYIWLERRRRLLADGE